MVRTRATLYIRCDTLCDLGDNNHSVGMTALDTNHSLCPGQDGSAGSWGCKGCAAAAAARLMAGQTELDLDSRLLHSRKGDQRFVPVFAGHEVRTPTS
jgi:hypothetical protein